MKFLPVIMGLLVIMLCITSCAAIEQPMCYKNVKPPIVVREFTVVNTTPIQVGAGFVIPTLSSLKEMRSRFG